MPGVIKRTLNPADERLFGMAPCGCIMRRADGMMLRYCSIEHGAGHAGLGMRRGKLRGGPTGIPRAKPAYEGKKRYRELMRLRAQQAAGGAYRSEWRNWLRGYGIDYGPAKTRKK